MLKDVVRKLAKRSALLRTLYFVASDVWTGARYGRGDIETDSGTLHSALSVDDSVAYVEAVFQDYLTYGRLDHFSGLVAEVGPGDNCGVALLCRADGARGVDMADRFFSKRDPAAQAEVYRALARRHPGVAALLASADVLGEESFAGVRRVYGPQAAAEVFFDVRERYDFIISRAVLEHLYDPLGALARMASALRPGGKLLHKVDLRDHGLFSDAFGELKFLETPSWLHRRMTRHSGRPNRILVHRYREVLDQLGLEYSLLVTRLAGVGSIEPHVPFELIPDDKQAASLQYVDARRQRFAREFHEVDSRDLCVTGVFIVARRPG